jgi:hypothetical protein
MGAGAGWLECPCSGPRGVECAKNLLLISLMGCYFFSAFKAVPKSSQKGAERAPDRQKGWKMRGLGEPCSAKIVHRAEHLVVKFG